MESTTKILVVGAAVGLLFLATKGTSTPPLPVNLVVNNSFEQKEANGRPTGWTFAQNGANAVFTVESDIYGSNVAAEYVTNTGTEISSISQSILVTGGKSYKLGGKIKNTNVAVTGGVSVYIRWIDAAGVFISNGQMMATINGTSDWANYEGILASPVNAAQAIVACTLARTTGKVWFDDIYLYEVL